MVGHRPVLIACAAALMLLNSCASAQSNGTMDVEPEVENATRTDAIEDDGKGRIESKRELESFTAISSCLPFNVLIAPGPDNVTFSLIVDAEKEVTDAIVSVVDDEVLVLSTSGGFNTTLAIKVTVEMPRTALATLERVSAADLVLAPGFEVESLRVLSGASSVGRFIATGLTASQITIENRGVSTVFVEGTIDSARVAASGTGTVYLIGVTDDIDIDASQIARINLNPASDNVKIGGISSGIAKIRTTRGVCDVTGGRLLFPTCSNIDESAFPVIQQVFSCGVIVDGMISCASGPGESQVITSAAANGESSTASASASATGTGETTTAQATAGPGGAFALVTPEGAADAVAVAPQTCEETADALLMLPA